MVVFGPISLKTLYRLSNNWSDPSEQDLSMMSWLPLIERVQQYLLQIGRNEIFNKNVIEFPTLRHLPSECDILTTVTPNLSWLEPVETRNLDLFRDIKFKEIETQKGLKTVAQKLD